MNKKTCPVCGKEFSTDLSYKKYCSDECRTERNRKASKEWYRNHKEEAKVMHAKWYSENRSKNKENCKRYYQKNREKLKSYSREYYQEHRDKILKDKKRHYCEQKHDMCLSCPNEDGECLFN